MSQPLPDISPGTLLAERYRVDALLGRGSMGAVYKGTQLSMKRPVAIKMLATLGDDAATWKKRFEREAVVTSQLHHPNTVRLYDYGTADSGESFLVMELLKGRPLHQVLREDGPLDPDRAVDLTIQILASLEEAHGAGIIHRDLKPANIFVTPMRRGREHVKVLDFGVAKITRDPSMQRLTQTSALVGTPHFMAPEQGRAEELDGRADLYAAGCILFAMLTGQPPFLGTQIIEIVLGHLDKPIPRLRALRPELSELLQPAIDALMAKEADDRPRNAHEAIEMLEDVLAGLDQQSQSGGASDTNRTVPMDVVSTIPPPPARRSSQRRRLKRPISGANTPAKSRAVKAAPKTNGQKQPAPKKPASKNPASKKPSPVSARRKAAHKAPSEAPRTRALRPPSIRKPAANLPKPRPTEPEPTKLAKDNSEELPLLPDDALQAPSEPAATRAVRPAPKAKPRLPARPKKKPAKPFAQTGLAKRPAGGTKLEFEFQMRGHRGDAEPSARIWVDVNADGEMQYDEEITDLTIGGGSWRGSQQLEGDSAEGVGFLVRFEASRGTRWRLRVWSSLPKRHLVFEQRDRLHEDTGRVIGWCKA